MTPRDLRQSKGLTLREAADQLNGIDPDVDLSYGTLHHIETDGTYNIKVIRAMASLYDRTMEDIERCMDTAKNCRKNLQEHAVCH